MVRDRGRGQHPTQGGAAPKRHRVDLLTVLFIFVAVAIGGAVLVLARQGGSTPGPPRAVIIDQLAATYPNPAFVSQATATLARAGFAVDYVAAPEVTVDLFRELPRKHYRVVIFRNHASRSVRVHERSQPGGVAELPIVSLFTSESYDQTKYTGDAGRLFKVHYDNGTQDFFGISPLFVRDAMRGSLTGAIVIAMGCDGMSSPGMAQAFIQKGAESFISWDKPVSASHTDLATEALLKNLLLGRLSTPAAIQRTMNAVGLDPYFGSRLGYVERASG